ncbi:sigma-70 family RNA polymerase sigma factor, partial [Streptomyces sp. SID11233]|nr:sigma-70 family RNA polymerase sigma factor [Streptomyces sp. SID11233]
AVHVPRRLQEARVELAKANEELSTRLGRAPKVSELAALMNLSEQQVVEAQIAANGYSSSSLDATIGGEDSGEGEAVLSDFIGAEDPGMELVEDLHALAPLLAGLEPRDRQILELRFGQELTQAQIGERLGVSQMHVSRLLNRTLGTLRAGLMSER